MQTLTYKYRLLPARQQHVALLAILESQRQLYNAALEERIDCYKKTGKGRTYIDQCKSLTECRRDLPEMSALPLNIQRGTLRRIDEAFKGFFNRVRRGEKPGFPRFRGKDWFHGFSFNEFAGISFDGRRLRFKGMPSGLRVHLHRAMPNGEIVSARFKRDHKGWSVCLVVNVETAEKRVISSSVGIDVGIRTLAATSDGLLIPNPRAARKAERIMRRAQRHLERCKRGSAGRRKARARVARLHAKIANTRSTALHQVSAMLVKRYDLIVVEALNTRGLAKGMLARDVYDAGWTKFRGFVRYKAERAGAHFVEVDPKFTSQDCANCGTRVPKALKDRWHCCPTCGAREDRDINAARNILSRAAMGPGTLKWSNHTATVSGKLIMNDASQ